MIFKLITILNINIFCKFDSQLLDEIDEYDLKNISNNEDVTTDERKRIKVKANFDRNARVLRLIFKHFFFIRIIKKPACSRVLLSLKNFYENLKPAQKAKQN